MRGQLEDNERTPRDSPLNLRKEDPHTRGTKLQQRRDDVTLFGYVKERTTFPARRTLPHHGFLLRKGRGRRDYQRCRVQ